MSTVINDRHHVMSLSAPGGDIDGSSGDVIVRVSVDAPTAVGLDDAMENIGLMTKIFVSSRPDPTANLSIFAPVGNKLVWNNTIVTVNSVTNETIASVDVHGEGELTVAADAGSFYEACSTGLEWILNGKTVTKTVPGP